MLTLCAFHVAMVYSCRLYSTPVHFANQRATVGTLVLIYQRAELFPFRNKVTLDRPLTKDSFE